MSAEMLQLCDSWPENPVPMYIGMVRRQPHLPLSTDYFLPLCERPDFLPGNLVAHYYVHGEFTIDTLHEV